MAELQTQGVAAGETGYHSCPGWAAIALGTAYRKWLDCAVGSCWRWPATVLALRGSVSVQEAPRAPAGSARGSSPQPDVVFPLANGGHLVSAEVKR